MAALATTEHIEASISAEPSTSTAESTPSTSSTGADTASTTPSTPAEPSDFHLDIKYVDSRYKEDPEGWENEDTPNAGDVAAELVQPLGMETSDESWDGYCFVVVRKHPTPEEKANGNRQIRFEIVLKSRYLVQACQEVMGDLPGISWTSQPVTLRPQLLLTFFPKLEAYEKEQAQKSSLEETEERMLASIRVLTSYLRQNYRQTLTRIASLLSNGEITFDLLYAVLVPGTVIVRRDAVTREIRALRLRSATKGVNSCGQPLYSVDCEGLEASGADADTDGEDGIGWTDEDKSTVRFGYTRSVTNIRHFTGVEKISTLSLFPLQYHPDAGRVREALLERARKWAALSSVHHMHFKGTAARREWVQNELVIRRFTVKSRIMIDKGNFERNDPNYDPPAPERMLPLVSGKSGVESLSDDDALLASPVLYGYSFSDKLWFEFSVSHVSEIEWNDEAFTGLILPSERKSLLLSLIEANGKLNESAAFDDFVRGKGQGLVINLFGPPGVGKTMSAEATSEHLRRPLFVIGSGDLGTTASELDDKLETTFTIAACWNAVLLIDEADVFLEQRSLHDMERNAMVAVFLRHVEYYRGILFLTTNRITTFDEAFLSRIHVALHFAELSAATKRAIWAAFLAKIGLAQGKVDDARLDRLAARDINGRQIKNACRTATSLALSRGETVGYGHLQEALDAMEEFVTEFTALQSAEKKAA
ncbi:P-loop containing nucleoside triphosphate hydrolase protein [Epithele typhae]|uniref:P-loop containing nucleoside triphosphate hydrolase protein n=1 Tax=Epithele typhae TaxID=378194 RepID=UPI002008414A|nr:P-loop containing nucleoside triphosphate hydrolase protein [Epithele typhae]KAH9925953.1 P-loop containing nucleoside triphosphate hydrolase protein [Epithele typhae]